MEYIIRRTPQMPAFEGRWAEPPWTLADDVTLEHFHKEGSEHRPTVAVKALYDASHVYVHFRVEDCYVKSIRTNYQDMVCNDSCVEFFVQPKPDHGYFNFEINAGGTMLLYYTVLTPDGPDEADRTEVPAKYGAQVRVYHSLPEIVDPEIAEPVTWQIEFGIPIALLESYVGPLSDPAGQRWRGNFYKCGDETSHPHWAQWSPVIAGFSFHQPQYFGVLCFEPKA